MPKRSVLHIKVENSVIQVKVKGRVGSLEFGSLCLCLFGGVIGSRGIAGFLRARLDPFKTSNFIF